MKVRSILSALTLGALAVGAQAGDVKNYLASGCEVATGSSYSTSFSVSPFFGYIQNTSTTLPLYVTCPIVRDDTQANNTVANGWIRVRDRSTTEDVRCAFYRVYASGTTASGQVKYSAGSSFTTQKLSYSNKNAGDSEDTLQFYCVIPPNTGGGNSGVYSYSVDEL